MTTSFILTNSEWRFVTHGRGDALSLIEKGLATLNDSDVIELSRELLIVAEEAKSAEATEIESGVFALRGDRFCLLLEPYRNMPDALKIALYRDSTALDAAIRERRGENNGEIAD
jgi:hypothetical protein